MYSLVHILLWKCNSRDALSIIAISPTMQLQSCIVVNCQPVDMYLKQLQHILDNSCNLITQFQLSTYQGFQILQITFPFSLLFSIPGKLKQFVQDLHSGKLHREFHNGPEHVRPSLHTHAHTYTHTYMHTIHTQHSHMLSPCCPTPYTQAGDHHGHQAPQEHHQGGGGGGHDGIPDVPPDSTFKKLQPAKSRYSFAERDEL